ncbi:hypothetical protein [Phytomonospora endophytica]|uniref:Uncharacterized protein n=1 Tax=Phytomonospora endophytica TaxID=714109 RepID=A0A841F9Q0_9ACTN|nr:hypothetical protein [Phytomonospora endophytica]MBB6032976.1 hypothetical protein [Phytomonospora endophytica]GIG65202.1 hypothetical protein Pen01_14970 [Phytomonospora endophytica]
MDTHTRPLRDEADLRALLATTLDLLDPASGGIPYRLVGTAAALLQGVVLPAGDIDVLFAAREGVDAFAAAFADREARQPPVWLPEAGQYFAEFVLDGVRVSASTVEHPDGSVFLESGGKGAWRHYVDVRCGSRVVPAVRLELRLVTELVRDRPDRRAPILAHLVRHGADVPLLERALAAAGVPEGRSREVLARVRRSRPLTPERPRSPR